MTSFVYSSRLVNVTANAVAFTIGTANATQINAISTVKKPTTKVLFKAGIKAISMVARPKTVTVFSNVLRAFSAASRPTTKSSVSYLVFKDRAFGQTGNITVKTSQATFDVPPTLTIPTVYVTARVPTTKAVLIMPLYVDTVVSVRTPETKSEVHVPFGIRARGAVHQVETPALVFIPPFTIDASSTTKFPQTKTDIRVPVVLSGYVRAAAPKLDGNIGGKFNLSAVLRPGGPPKLAGNIGLYATTYGYLTNPAAPRLNGSLALHWEVTARLVATTPKLTGSLENDPSYKVTANLVVSAAPRLLSAEPPTVRRRRTINIIKW